MMLWHEPTLHHTHSDIRYVGPSCASTSLNHLNQYLIFRSDTTMQGVMEVPMCFVQICSTDSIFSYKHTESMDGMFTHNSTEAC